MLSKTCKLSDAAPAGRNAADTAMTPPMTTPPMSPPPDVTAVTRLPSVRSAHSQHERAARKWGSRGWRWATCGAGGEAVGKP